MSLKVYKASAGSGKTYRLALEYIAYAIATPSSTAFANILAVTFTNKATAEMKQRILAKLYNIANGIPDGTFLDDLRTLLPSDLSEEEIRKRAKRTLLAIVHDYDRFRVETIDSFFQSLLTNLAHELNLKRGFKVNLDSDEVISRAVNRMLLSIGKSTRLTGRVVKLIIDFMEEQIDDAKGWKIADSLKQFAKNNIFNEIYLHHESEIEARLSDNQWVADFKQHIRQRYQEDFKKLPLLAEELKTALQQVDASLLSPSKFKSVLTYANKVDKEELIASNKDFVTIQKYIDDLPEVFLLKAQKANPQSVALAESLHARLCQVERMRQKIVAELLTSKLSLERFVPYCLLSEISREVTRICNESGSLLLAKTPDLFDKMVEKNDASFVFERAGTTFNHVMIDEFQDTSLMQWSIFSRLLIENISQGNDCMVVGDIKQSIYRWRGGDWEILDRIQGKQETLKRNYRSKFEVVQFNNQFFTHTANYLDSLAGPILSEKKTIARIYEGGEQEYNNTKAGEGYVRACLLDKEVSEEELMDDLYRQIQQLHTEQGIPYSKMLILVRRNPDGARLVDYFAEHYPEVQLTSSEAFMLDASPAVKMIVYAMKYLNDKTDTVALAYCLQQSRLLGDACGYEPTWLPEQLEAHREQIGIIPLYLLGQQLMHLFGLSEAENHAAGQSAYLFTFFDRLLQYINDNDSDLASFLSYWDEILHKQSIPADSQEAIMIMTIHKAKGLEQHTVFIPFCNWPVERDFPDDIIWCPTSGMKQPFNEIPLLPIPPKSMTSKSGFAPFYEVEHLYQRIDNINLLYVAFTRAGTNLFIWSQPPKKGSPSCYEIVNAYFVLATPADSDVPQKPKKKGEKSSGCEAELWKEFTLGRLATYDKGNKEKKATNTTEEEVENPFDIRHIRVLSTPLRQQHIKVTFKQSNRAKDFLEELSEPKDIFNTETATASLFSAEEFCEMQSSYIDRGRLLHHLFQMIRTQKDIGPALHSMLQQGLIEGAKEKEQLRRLIDRRLQNPTVARWFEPQWALYTECNIWTRTPDGSIRECRPDRVIISPQETIVIDYKFGRPNTAYHDQVRNYMDLLRHMDYPNVKGYIWYVYSGEVDEVKF